MSWIIVDELNYHRMICILVTITKITNALQFSFTGCVCSRYAGFVSAIELLFSWMIR